MDRLQAPQYSRDWGTHLVKAKLSEDVAREHGQPWPTLASDEVDAHRALVDSNFECQIFVLGTPIVVDTRDVTDIIATHVGGKLVRIYPPFIINEVAETAGALMLIGTAICGIPVSTTHTIAGSIMGVGATQRLSAVRWGIALRIVWAWVLTIPLSALLAALTWLILPK